MFKNLGGATLGSTSRPSEVIELALSFGFKGLDLNLLDFAEQVKSAGLPHARRLIDSARLKIGSFTLPVEWQADNETFQKDLALLAERAGLAAQVGCTRAVTQILPGSNERPYHQNFETCRQRLAEIGKVLEPLGIRLGVGFVGASDQQSGFSFQFIRDFDALAMFIGMVPSRAIGLLIDPWDIRAAGGSLESLKKLALEKIVAVQVADAAEDIPPPWSSANRALPGESGVIDLATLLIWLAELGYDGPITPAPDASRLTGMKREVIVRTAGERIDAAWKAAGLNAAGKLTLAGAKK